MSDSLVRWEEESARDPSAGFALICEVVEAMPAQFHLPQQWEPSEDDAYRAYELLRQMLSKVILRLVDRDMNRLMQILYRVDVSEEKVKRAFQGEFSEIPIQLADLIIERQLQKVFTRKTATCDKLPRM